MFKARRVKSHLMKKMTRRTFVSGLFTGAAGMLFGSCAKSQSSSQEKMTAHSEASEEEKNELKIKRYNPLGSTGIEVSDIVFGAGAINVPHLVRYAYDFGVNLFDTSAWYGSGVSEESIGQGLNGVRDNAYIITKQYYRKGRRITKDSIRKVLEQSLKNLQTDYVDGLFIHTMDTTHLLKNEVVISSYIQFKKEGKVRFTGFSTHNEVLTLAECVKPEYEEFVDVVMFCYNHMEGKRIEPLIAAMREKGIGTIAMKTLAGGKQGNLKEFVDERLSYPHAAVSWALANKHVDCAALTMDNYSMVENFVAASGKKLKRTDLALLQKYRDAASKIYCRMSCSSCESSCPHNVAISDIMRFAMYFEDYGQQKKAIDHYAALSNAQKPVFCQSCPGHCAHGCPYGLQVKEQLLMAHNLLAV